MFSGKGKKFKKAIEVTPISVCYSSLAKPRETLENPGHLRENGPVNEG